LYSSIVREKAVREAEREPRAEGVRADEGSEKEGEVRFVRSFRMEVLCLSAELKCVFWWEVC
jgi:hypothetical protein